MKPSVFGGLPNTISHKKSKPRFLLVACALFFVFGVAADIFGPWKRTRILSVVADIIFPPKPTTATQFWSNYYNSASWYVSN